MSLKRNQFVAEVRANVPLCREHYKLVLQLPAFPVTSPGQFIQVACRMPGLDVEDRELDWRPGEALCLRGAELNELALLRRPFSLAGRRDVRDGVELDLIARTVGRGTQWMSALRAGDEVDLIGPLGNAFELPGEEDVALLVGGGVGIPPMIYLASALVGRKAVAFCGALTRDLLPLTITNAAPTPGTDSFEPLYNVDEFATFGVAAILSTDDGSYGYRGFVTQALERYLDSYFQHRAARSRAIVYTCGPEVMMKRVAAIADARGIACQVAVERAMACGMGTCQSCCIRVRKPDPAAPPLAGKDWCYKLACTDGPVFRSVDLLW